MLLQVAICGLTLLHSERPKLYTIFALVGWLVVLGYTALLDSISVYIRPSAREREIEKRSDRLEKKCPNNPHHTYCKRSRPLPYSNPNY